MENLFQKDERIAFAKRIFRKIFLEDWLTKLFALGITLALWLGVTGLQKPITTRLNNLALQPRLSNNFEITGSPIPEVALVITGDGRKIDEIKSENLIVSIDLTDVKAGEQILQLTPDSINVALPTGVKVVEIQPNKIPIKIEAVEEREIPVRVETEGKLAEGFEIYNAPILPQKIRVRAPSSFIKSLEFISTEKINIDGRQTDFTAQRVPLNIVNPRITVFDTVVDVFFRIGEKRIERLFLVPVQTDGGEKKATVILYGTRTILGNLMPESLKVEITKNDAGETSLQLVMPAEIQDKVEIRKLKMN